MSTENVSRRTVIGTAAGLGTAAAVGSVSIAEAAAAERSRERRHPERKVVLITGTSSGFGHLTALTLARAGHRVFASMRGTGTANAGPARELAALARDEGLALEVVDIDVRDERSVERGVRRVLHRAGRIDVLFNNAGVFCPAVLETLTVEDLKDSFETNLFGHLRMNRAVLPAMRERGEGLVIQMTTALGRFVLPFMGSYLAAKWALEALAESSRYELSRLGVECVIVEPGAYRTEFLDNARRYYQDYLRRLSREDAHRREEYGELAVRAESHLEPGDASFEPQEIADAVAGVVRTPRGERPLRLVGPGVEEFLAEVNAASEGVSSAVITGSGWDDLLELRTRP